MRPRPTEAFIWRGPGRPKSRVEMRPDSVTFFTVSAPAASRLKPLLPAVAAAILALAGFGELVALSGSYAGTGPAEGESTNLVVDGFRSGHVWLAKDAPPELARAANPYDFATYRPYLGGRWGLVDLSYYHGHLYAYFGVTPAIVLFWPYRELTGSYLHESRAVLLFCALGYLVSVGLALAAWRRYFPSVGAWAGAAIALVLGSVTTLPVFLVRPGLYEVSISCGFAFTMLSLAALWNAWHRPSGKAAWLAGASLAFGLAVGARPSLLFGAFVLFLPAIAAFRGPGKAPWRATFLAAFLPISAVGAGLAAYNFWRFGSPLQFGHDYQLSGNDVTGTKSFDPRFFWDNFRLYFLEPLRWHAGFPWVWEPPAPPLSKGHLPIEFSFGTLTTLPILLAAALAPMAWTGIRPGRNPPRALAGAWVALVVLFLAGAVPICCYAGATSRYLLDFIPALALLALLGFLGIERAIGAPVSGAAPRGARAPLVRVAVGSAVAYSVAMGWLLAVALSLFYRGAERGIALLNAGQVNEAVAVYEDVCRINPDFRGQAELAIGTTLLSRGQPAAAVGFLGSAARDRPGVAAAHFNLGKAYAELGRFRESGESFRRAAALDPADAEAQAELGDALFRQGRVPEAILSEEAALRIDPGLTLARSYLQVFDSAGQNPPKP
jgi:hypothetical protein